jgi:hypothetical protein
LRRMRIVPGMVAYDQSVPVVALDKADIAVYRSATVQSVSEARIALA